MKTLSLKELANEVTLDQEEKIFTSGKCALCGKETLTDQFDFCEDCGKRMVRLEGIPLLSLVPIPYIKIDMLKIPTAFKEAVYTFKEVMKSDD